MDLLLDNGKENTARDQCKLVHSLSKKHPEDAFVDKKCTSGKCAKRSQKASNEPS